MEISLQQIQVRKGLLADANWIASLCHQQFQMAHFGGLSTEDMKYYVDKTFTPAEVKKDLAVLSNQYLVVETESGETLGVVKLGPVNLDVAKSIDYAIEITRFYLQPFSIGKGIGSILMRESLALANELEYTSIWVHVYQKNKNAISFYEKWGFVKMGKQEFAVRKSQPVGWVMKRDL